MALNFLVNIPIADLRTLPQSITTTDYSLQNLRSSQLLYGEKLHLIKTQDAWAKVRALEQPRYSDARGWHSYEGWLHLSEIKQTSHFLNANYVVCSLNNFYSIGTHLQKPLSLKATRPIPKVFDRQQIIKDANLFLNAPYLWGGRASQLKGHVASVDCSGLVNLLYRMQGIQLPRDAYDQFLFSRPTKNLLPADPLYLAKSNRVNHVILKLTENLFIEAPETGKHVRLLRWGKDIWEKEGQIAFFDRQNTYTPFPRTFSH